MKNKIFVLGSNSFSGSHFIDYVLKNTDNEVIGISRSAEYSPVFLPYLYRKYKRPERFRFYQIDINNLEKLAGLIDEEKPDVIANFAAQAEVRNSWNSPLEWFRTNTMALVSIANHLRGKSYLEKFLAVSTPEVYGTTEKNMKETDRFNPSSPYAISKLAGDLFLRALFQKEGFPVVFTRAANVYGAHQQTYRLIPKTIISLKKDKKIQLNNEGRSLRSFLHIRDAVDGYWKAIEHGRLGEVYHISRKNDLVSIKNVVKTICDIIGRDFSQSTEMGKIYKWRDSVYSLDASKAMSELNWQPTISLKDGIQETINWIEDNWAEIKDAPLEYQHKA